MPILLLLVAVLGCGDFRPQKNAYKNKRQLVNEYFEIAPGEWRAWPFEVTERAARVNGSYSTQGGADHEIEFWVVKDKYKEQIMQKGTGEFVYRSTEAGSGRHRQSILREIEPGNYYLLFRSESSSREHSVTVRMSLEW